LNTGKVAGAAIDHFPVQPLSPEDPLTSMDKVVLTPHLSASSWEAMSRMAVQVSEGVLITLKGGIPENPVVM
jgi:D-3-phosphoglycerate dehydrogenase